MHSAFENIQTKYATTRANLSLGSKPRRRRYTEVIHIEDFDIDCGSLAVDVEFSYDVEREAADPSTGYDQETFTVTGDILAVTVSAHNIRRNMADPFACDLLNFISEDTLAAKADLGCYEQFLCDQIQTEYESGDRTPGGSLAAE
ncbi:hypothetical protein N6L27_03610 [Leisingera sp. SS27]|uniref:hypothetical protein n=1 Tax=Leisingera sp. SS27 TaxID=2979462 RepID=UPI00232C1F84|nr:hypothetical protein [Leisingera sp. SS27]MDC0657077.1 hypothetical protein [Leisingera sp. SS27]